LWRSRSARVPSSSTTRSVSLGFAPVIFNMSACRSQGDRGRAGRVALRPLVGDGPAMHQEIHRLGDVGGVVADALDVLGAEQEMGAEPDIARILHHVGEELA